MLSPRTTLFLLLVLAAGHASAVCTSPAGDDGRFIWSASESKLKFCSGDVWIGMDAKTPSPTACAGSPAGTAKFFSGNYYFCDGTNWISMKGPASVTSAATCSGQTGKLTWNGTTKMMEICDGTAWYYASLCPPNYVHVPKLSGYTTEDFCIAKYEMRIAGNNVGDTTYSTSMVAESRATGTPWTSISYTNAVNECAALGTGYALVSNAQWQTLARNLELVGANWQTGIVTGTSLSRGHDDGVPANTLASSVDSDPCYLTGQTCSQSTWNSQRRTMKLSNGELIWDLAGNADEWVLNGSTLPAVSFPDNDQYVSQIVNSTTITNYGPTNNYSSFNSPFYAGLGLVYYVSSRPLTRGGRFDDAGAPVYGAGIFSAYWDYTNAPFSQVGFRCVYQP